MIVRFDADRDFQVHAIAGNTGFCDGECTNEKTPFGASFAPALTGCPPAEYRITSIIDRTHGVCQADFSFFSGREVRLDGQTVRLTQAAMARRHQTMPPSITLHIKAVREKGELDKPATCKDYLQVRLEERRHT